MSLYKVEFRPEAVREIKKIDPRSQRWFQGAIELLAQNPHPPNSQPLKSRPGYRLRVGDFQIIYTVEDRRLVILMVVLDNYRETDDVPSFRVR